MHLLNDSGFVTGAAFWLLNGLAILILLARGLYFTIAGKWK